MKAVFDQKARAMGATILFSLAGMYGLMFLAEKPVSVPLIIFYATITVNTFFSIKLFSSLTPKGSLSQAIVDAILFFLYIALVFCFNSAIMFSFIVTLLFIVAALKYTLLLGVVDHPRLLKKKITIDISGIMMGALSLLVIAKGYPVLGSWALAGVFLAANIFFLLLKPMYRI